MITLEELAVPLEGENPAGENLEYDPLYIELDSLAVAVPDSEIGDSKIEGHGADWKKLRENCLALWGRTRDLRVASYLVIAETAMGGFKDCGEALKLIAFLVRDMWETVYPRLDPDDDNDPTERLNILAMLSPEPGAFNDPIMFISKVRSLRLVPMLPYTLRDYLISINELETADGQRIDTNLIAAELMNIPQADKEEQVAVVREIRETLKAICADAGEKMSGGFSRDMTSFSREIDRLCKFYATYLESGGGSGESVADGEAETGGEAPMLAGGQAGGQASGQAIGQGSFNLSSYKPANRTDALLLLRKSSEYFQQHEPNSPIPLLVNRALRFSEMNFIELIEDIVPDALSRGKEIMGIKEESSS
jgi:type VI secretion system protein ImpA